MTSAGQRVSGAVLAISGVILFVHPIYLERFLIYPGVGWSFVPLVHAALSTIGTLSIVCGIAISIPRYFESWSWIGVAIATVVVVSLYGLLLSLTITVDQSFVGSGVHRTFVSGLFVGTFLGAGGVVGSDHKRIAGGVAIPGVLLGPVVVDWAGSAPLEPLLELHFLLTGAPIAAVPYLGTILLTTTLLLGVTVEVIVRQNSNREQPSTDLEGPGIR